MGVCEWLEQVRKLDELIDAKLAERDKLWAMATSVTVDSDGMPHAKGNVSDPVGNAAVKLRMLAEEIDRLIDVYVEHKEQVIRALEKLPHNEYGVMHRHYIRYMTWEDVAEDMGYSTVQIWRLKKNALKILQDVIECKAIK